MSYSQLSAWVSILAELRRSVVPGIKTQHPAHKACMYLALRAIITTALSVLLYLFVSENMISVLYKMQLLIFTWQNEFVILLSFVFWCYFSKFEYLTDC